MCPNMYLNLVELSNYMSIVSVCEIVFSATSFHLLLNESPKVTQTHLLFFAQLFCLYIADSIQSDISHITDRSQTQKYIILFEQHKKCENWIKLLLHRHLVWCKSQVCKCWFKTPNNIQDIFFLNKVTMHLKPD